MAPKQADRAPEERNLNSDAKDFPCPARSLKQFTSSGDPGGCGAGQDHPPAKTATSRGHRPRSLSSVPMQNHDPEMETTGSPLLSRGKAGWGDGAMLTVLALTIRLG